MAEHLEFVGRGESGAGAGNRHPHISHVGGEGIRGVAGVCIGGLVDDRRIGQVVG